MNREEVFDNIEILLYALISVNVIMVFIIPALVCRLVNDNKVNH
jgi:hypothetical protein